MSKRFTRNLIAVLLVILYCLALLAFGGCTSIKMERHADGSEKIVVRAPPKDFKALDFKWHETRLRAGEAATADQPWADVAGDAVGVGSLLLNTMAYCKAYPVMCSGQQGTTQYSPETIRRAETFCTAFPSRCEK